MTFRMKYLERNSQSSISLVSDASLQCFVNLFYRFISNFFYFRFLFTPAVDGIYPKLARFLLTVSDPVHLIDRIFGGWQEARRKDIERAFGVYQRKFHCVVRPFEKWDDNRIAEVVLCCILLHNMMVEHRVANDEVDHEDLYELAPAAGPVADPDADAERRDEERVAAAREQGAVTLAQSEKGRRQRLLPFAMRVVQRRWGELVDREENARLQAAIKRHAFAHRHDQC